MILCKLFQNRPLMEVKHLTEVVKWMSLIYCCSSNQSLGGKSEQKVFVERTISSEDVSLFAKLTGDFNKIHSDSGRKSLVHGALLNGIVSGVIGTKLPGHGTIVLSQTLNFPNPCYVGETVEVTVEIGDLRKIITCNYKVVNKSSKSIVLEGSAKLLLRSLKE